LALYTEAISEGKSVCGVEFKVENVVANTVVHWVDGGVDQLRGWNGTGRVFPESNDPELFSGTLDWRAGRWTQSVSGWESGIQLNNCKIVFVNARDKARSLGN